MDMLHGSLGDKIIRFALPVAATGILQQLFNAADIAVIGRFVGKEAMAAVGSNNSLIGLMVTMFGGIAMGANVVIARSTGQGNREGIRHAVHTSILIAFVGGLLMTVIGELLAGIIGLIPNCAGRCFTGWACLRRFSGKHCVTSGSISPACR